MLDCGEMYLRRLQKDTKMLSCPYVRVINLISYIESTYAAGTMVHHPGFNDSIWLLFSGDKGGSSMKFMFSIANDVKNGSVDNNHIFCMYSASDCLSNMWKVFYPLIQQIEALQKEEYRLDGKKVQVFLSGDFHFQDDMLGHGGSASSYPSSADFVSLQHLRNHGPEKHSIESCKIPLRTVEWYHKYYNDNRADTRANGDLRENAKHHYSVIERMLFPIKDLKCVVPAVLHLSLIHISEPTRPY